jgi:myo-inositol-1(or 4)-monophosphatase
VPIPVDVDPAALLDVAERTAREAGAMIFSRRPEHVEVAETKSSPTDVVTLMDRAAEDLIRRRLSAARPDDGILGEERGLQAGSSGLTWVVDPIDGTVNYLYAIPVYAVSVAVVVGDPLVPGRWAGLAGCVHNPVTGQTWTAVAGGGAWQGPTRLRPAGPPSLEQALVATGFGYLPEGRRVQAELLARLLPEVRDVRRIGSAAIDLCMVASGELDAYYERGLHEWDMAAATLVVQEAGRRVVGIAGEPPGAFMVVAAADPLCTQLAARLEELGAASA